MIPKIKERLERAEVEFNAKGLPPLNVDECKEFLFDLIEIAHERPLSKDEIFLHGQLIAQYKMAITAEMLGRKGERYYVFSATELKEHLELLDEANT